MTVKEIPRRNPGTDEDIGQKEIRGESLKNRYLIG